MLTLLTLAIGFGLGIAVGKFGVSAVLAYVKAKAHVEEADLLKKL